MSPSLLLALALIGLLGCQQQGESAQPTPQPMQSKPGTRPILGLDPGWELAPRGTYSATQKAGEVTIKASGENPTAGYRMKLVQSPLRIWPPQWVLARKPPEGIVAQVITPYEVSASFQSNEAVKAVVVSDAEGRNTVNVEQVKE